MNLSKNIHLKNILAHPIFLYILIAANAPEEINSPYLITSGLLILLFSHLKSKWVQHLQFLGILAALYFIISKFKTIFNLDAGCNFLTLLLGLKALDIKQDSKKGFVFIGLALNASYSLYHQDLGATLLLIGSFIWGYGLLFHLTLLDNNAKANFQIKLFKNPRIYLYIFFTVFVAISFYIFFPRITFNLPKDSGLVSNSGFSPELNPGTQARLNLSNHSIFSVSFSTQAPAIPQLYWIGSVLDKTDGYHWQSDSQQSYSLKKNMPSNLNQTDYQIQLHTQSTEYLFHLDTPISRPEIPLPFYMTSNKSFKLYNEVPSKLKYNAVSIPGLNLNEKPKKPFTPPKKYLKTSYKVVQLAEQLKASDSRQTLTNIQDYFTKENYVYSLEPGQSEILDDFLFKSKKGFCSHYASAVAILLRYAGIQSRVITGFQGGEYNDIGNFYVLKGKDAHAWVEYQNESYQWIRVDPVEWIKPDRIRLGGQRFFALSPNGEIEIENMNRGLFESIQYNISMYVDNINRTWQSLLYNYDREAQQNFARKLGLSLWRFFLIGIFLIPLGIIFILYYFYQRSHKDALVREIMKIEKLAKRMGISRRNNQSFNQFLNEILTKEQKLSFAANRLREVSNSYLFSGNFSGKSITKKEYLSQLIEFRKYLRSVLK